MLPSGSSLRSEPIPLFSRWAWYELGKQTADTRWYFLTLHQLSFSAVVRHLTVRNSPPVELRLFIFLHNRCVFAMVSAQGTTRSARQNNRTALLWFLIKWGKPAAAVLAKHRELSEQTNLREPSCASDRQAVVEQETVYRLTNMSGGEILFQGWLRKSPPEKKLRRYVSHIICSTAVEVT